MADDAEPLIEFFKDANINAVSRVVERARNMAEKAARRNASASRVPRKAGALVKCMNKAMAAYGRSTKGRPSIRRTAPDTGGRPFHYSHTTITKNGSSRSKNAAGGTGASPSTATRKLAAPAGARAKKSGSTREGKHQLYVERADALERGVSLDQWRIIEAELDVGRDITDELGSDAPGQEQSRTKDLGAERSNAQDVAQEIGGHDRPGQDQGDELETEKDRSRGQAKARNWVDDVLSMEPGLSGRATEQAAQEYIENPSKAPEARMGMTSSFGTIGETLEERLKFWDLVHDHESDKGARTQTRLVLELPHEATPRQRHEIVRRFTDEFQARGIPYWASIHAPTGRNDDRNHHAHVVMTERPMRRMPHPATGEIVWDFTIQVQHKDKTRHTHTRYPHRQTRDPAMRDRGYVRASRARFAAMVNTVMEDSASPVRYDPRSYEAMGVDTEPMRNVARVLADKLDKRQFVVMDAEWTRRTIDAEMQAAAARRDATFAALQNTDQRLRDIAQDAKRSKAANAKLPANLRLSPGRVLARKAQDLVMNRMLGVRRDRLATRFVDEATLTALRHIAAATAPAKVGARSRRVHDPETAPDLEDLAALHAAAVEEIAALALTSRAKQAAYTARETELAREWREGGPGSGGAAPAPGGPKAQEGAGQGKAAQQEEARAPQGMHPGIPMPAPQTRPMVPTKAVNPGQTPREGTTKPGTTRPETGLAHQPAIDAASLIRSLSPSQTRPFWLGAGPHQVSLDGDTVPEPQQQIAPDRRGLGSFNLTHTPGGIMAGVATTMKAAIASLMEATGGDAPAFVDALDVMIRDMAATAARRREQEAKAALEREAAETRRRGVEALRPHVIPSEAAGAPTQLPMPPQMTQPGDSATQDVALPNRAALTTPLAQAITPVAASPSSLPAPIVSQPATAGTPLDPWASAPPARMRPPEPLPPLVYGVTLEGDYGGSARPNQTAPVKSSAAPAAAKVGVAKSLEPADPAPSLAEPTALPRTAPTTSRTERPEIMRRDLAAVLPGPADARPDAPETAAAQPAPRTPEKGQPSAETQPERSIGDLAAREKAADAAAKKRRRKALLAASRDGPG